jgi:nitrite reductase/ring-hydroxylating ferredoxin subunit
MGQFSRVASRGEIPPGKGKVVQASGKAIAVFNCDGSYYAIDNSCKHRGGPLGEGTLAGTVVSCPWHGWGYDVTSGACDVDPSISAQRYEVKVEGDDILVSVES